MKRKAKSIDGLEVKTKRDKRLPPGFDSEAVKRSRKLDRDFRNSEEPTPEMFELLGMTLVTAVHAAEEATDIRDPDSWGRYQHFVKTDVLRTMKILVEEGKKNFRIVTARRGKPTTSNSRKVAMPIIVANDPSAVDKVLRDSHLSLKAKGLFVLLAHQGSELQNEHQKLRAKASAKPYTGTPTEDQILADRHWLWSSSKDGKTSIHSAQKELEAAGYLVIEPGRSKGRITVPTWNLQASKSRRK